MHGHGQFSDKLYNSIQQHCPRAELVEGPVEGAYVLNGIFGKCSYRTLLDPVCKQLMQQMNEEIGGFFTYNLYDTCW